jgi:hypothetical protein
MKRSLALVPCLVAAVVPLFPAYAQTAAPAGSGDPPKIRSAAALVILGASRDAAFRKALLAAGLPPSSTPAPPSRFTLTPEQPQVPGASFSQIGPGTYSPALFGLTPMPDPQHPGSTTPANVTLSFATEGNAIYVVDCLFGGWVGWGFQGYATPIKFYSSHTSPQTVNGEGGHFLYSFRTGSGYPTDTVRLEVSSQTALLRCEISKV